jgi:hypothetical protein
LAKGNGMSTQEIAQAATTVVKKKFNYKIIEDKQQRTYLQSQETSIRSAFGRVHNSLVEVGNRLRDAKEAVGHGLFMQWIDGVFDMNYQTALRFMQVAEAFSRVNDLQSLGFQQSALYALSVPSVPEEARDEAIERAQAGEVITHKTAQEIVANHKTASTASEQEQNEKDDVDVDIPLVQEPAIDASTHNDLSVIAAPATLPENSQSVESEDSEELGEMSASSIVPELTLEERIAALPLAQALDLYSHRGLIFRQQAMLWYEQRSLIQRAHSVIMNTLYKKGDVADALRTLGHIPDPAKWEGCGTCKGTMRFGERNDPCNKCNGGFTIHVGEGVSADVVRGHAINLQSVRDGSEQ